MKIRPINLRELLTNSCYGYFSNALYLALCWVLSNACFAQDKDQTMAFEQTAVGIEYVFIDKPHLVDSLSSALSEIGFTAVKHYAEHVQWDAMQENERADIDFEKLDNYVREYQKKGFHELVICLKPHSRWASKSLAFFGPKNATPKSQFIDKYSTWINAVTERYDNDGFKDMPGLKYPVNHLEIGSELSTYQPGPIADYLWMLEHAYNAAHEASDTVIVSHAAFLTTPANLDIPFNDIPDAINKIPTRVSGGHNYNSIDKILSNPQLFDALNIHNLGDPYEIEHLVKWLRWESGRRRYDKPIIISDIISTSYIAWGPATSCQGIQKNLGLMIPPATEKDRCRISVYFDKLINKDESTLKWTRDFVARDAVIKAIIAAEQQVALINLAFVTDLPLMTAKWARAGAGITAWAGLVEIDLFGRVKNRRPIFYALKQLMNHLSGFERVVRLHTDNDKVRFYEIKRPSGSVYVGWLESSVQLPSADKARKRIHLRMPNGLYQLEPILLSAKANQDSKEIAVTNNIFEVVLSSEPTYIQVK